MSAIQRLQRLRVSDVMSREVVCVSAAESMADAARVFADHHVSSAPVVGESSRCVGMLSATDFVKRMQTPTHDDGVEASMTHVVQSVEPDAPLLLAAQMMCVRHLHRLPVLNAQSQPIGVVSTMDVVAALLTAIDEAAVNGE